MVFMWARDGKLWLLKYRDFGTGCDYKDMVSYLFPIHLVVSDCKGIGTQLLSS